MTKSSDKYSRIGKVSIYQAILAALAFVIPFTLYIKTLEPKLVGGDTSWFAVQVPKMEVLVPTGYPSFSIFAKLFTFIPIKDLAYRLNLLSAVFASLAVLFLYLALSRYLKNAAAAFAGALTFAFIISFWSIANRFELDAINSFFLALLLFSIFQYRENPRRKFAYFVAACFGLSLTDHPLTLFIIPPLFLYFLMIKPQVFKSLKTILLCIMYFILPLSLYAFLPVRSLQGYGSVTTLRGFFYYITGRYTTGQVHGGSFFDKELANFITVAKEFFLIIYKNFGPLLLLIALAGLVYLFKKDIKFALCSLMLILFNLVIITQFIGWAPQNHVLFTMTVITVYISWGFLLINDGCLLLLSRTEKRKKIKSGLKIVLVSILAAAFLISPVLLAVGNYRTVDRSSPEEIYLFWNRVFETVEKNSFIFVSSSSANIGIFIASYEQREKNISIIQNKDPGYSLENIREKLNSKSGVYLIGIEEFLIPFLNLKKLDNFHWPRFGENIVFYTVTSEKKQLEISPAETDLNVRFGDVFSVEYEISNKTDEDIVITSLELTLPSGAGFIEVDKNGSVNQQPGISQGKYMWVKNYTVGARSTLNLILKIRAQAPGQSLIKFRITSQDIYMDSPDISLNIEK